MNAARNFFDRVRIGMLVGIACAGGLGSVFAQTVDHPNAHAVELLKGLETSSEEVGTFEYTLRVDHFSKSGKLVESYLRLAVDVDRNRLYGEAGYRETANMKFIYADGEAVALNLEDDTTFSPPRELIEPFERWFDQALSPEITARDLEGATYMGVQRYGEVVRGEGVRVAATLPDYIGADLEKGPVELLFDDAGNHVASVYTVSLGEEPERVLTVYADPEDRTLAHYLNASHYALEQGRVTLVSETRLEHLAINEPLAESLFSFPAVQQTQTP